MNKTGKTANASGLDKLTKALAEKVRSTPKSPGVYLFKNARGKAIYIGKAKSLHSRVRSYFSKRVADPKTARMVSLVRDMEVIVTDSEVEALILEANLVKEHKPRYNIDLKDDKHLPYIQVTVNEPFPRILVARRIKNDGSRYFGPYTSAKSMRHTIRFIGGLFKIRTCNLTIPHPQGKEQKVCLEFHIGRCHGPCEDLQSEESYRESVDAVLLFLSGKNLSLIDELEEKMKIASATEEFERAAELRDQIEAMRSVSEKQKMDVGKTVDRDIVALALKEGEAMAVVLQIREGILIGRQTLRITPGEIDTKETVLEAFLEQYYNHQSSLPKELYLPFELENKALIAKWLTGAKGSRVKVHTPQKGDNVRLVEMAESNARLSLEDILIQKRGHREKIAPMVEALQKALGFKNPPRHICCFDISNTAETEAVGAMAYFRDAKPYKAEYRKFKIQTVTGRDDYAMMREVVGRYFLRRVREKQSLPDLVVIDGGKGQLNSALAELKSLKVTGLPVIGLAKKLEEIFVAGRKEPITLPKYSPELRLLKQIRDEAHRFGVEYNRTLRKKRTVSSQLDNIEGVGPARREALLKKFGSVKKLGEASEAEISATPGIPAGLAKKISAALKERISTAPKKSAVTENVK